MPEADSLQKTALDVQGLSHLVVAVDDLDRARKFYSGVLAMTDQGTGLWPGCNAATDMAVMGCAGGQHLVLALSPDQPDTSDTGVHFALGAGAALRGKIVSALGDAGSEIFTYHEDNPAECDEPLYFMDPAGNRVQIVAEKGTGDGAADRPVLDHVAVQVGDIQWAEIFYSQVLGFDVAHRVGWATADYARAQAWADGHDDMAPGTRRMDERYSAIINKKVVPRVNMQLFLNAGAGGLGLYLANKHVQESPEYQTCGVPRLGFRISRAGLDEAVTRLRGKDWLFEGPVEHGDGAAVSASVYCRDPGGNFIEFASWE